MKYVSIAMLQAGIRQKDMQISEALNDNNTLEKLRRERHDITNEVAKLMFSTKVQHALNEVTK